MARVPIKIGDTVEITLPWSEVCMHMGIADKRMSVVVTEHGAQLMNDDASFSFPITHGEAGIYRDTNGLYLQQEV